MATTTSVMAIKHTLVAIWGARCDPNNGYST